MVQIEESKQDYKTALTRAAFYSRLTLQAPIGRFLCLASGNPTNQGTSSQLDTNNGHEFLHGIGALLERRAFFCGQLDLEDVLDAPGCLEPLYTARHCGRTVMVNSKALQFV